MLPKVSELKNDSLRNRGLELKNSVLEEQARRARERHLASVSSRRGLHAANSSRLENLIRKRAGLHDTLIKFEYITPVGSDTDSVDLTVDRNDILVVKAKVWKPKKFLGKFIATLISAGFDLKMKWVTKHTKRDHIHIMKILTAKIK